MVLSFAVGFLETPQKAGRAEKPASHTGNTDFWSGQPVDGAVCPATIRTIEKTAKESLECRGMRSPARTAGLPAKSQRKKKMIEVRLREPDIDIKRMLRMLKVPRVGDYQQLV
jgi:hypothetical protein